MNLYATLETSIYYEAGDMYGVIVFVLPFDANGEVGESELEG